MWAFAYGLRFWAIIRLQIRNEAQNACRCRSADPIHWTDVHPANLFLFSIGYPWRNGGCNQIADRRKACQHSNLRFA
jgi:hypothetical protein